MSNVYYNIIVLFTCWLLVAGAGVYVTFFQQPDQMEQLQKAEKLARLKQAEVTALIAEESTSKQRAQETLRKWSARYKVIPDRLESTDVLSYLNELTETGFENFDVTSEGVSGNRDVSFHIYSISGRGVFHDLYRVIWSLENNSNLYRIRDVTLDHMDLIKKDKATDRDKLQVVVSFRFKLEAYFGGRQGLSAEDDVVAQLMEQGGDGLPSPGTGLPAVPADVLPTMKPAVNPFNPLIMETLPPNTYGLVEVEKARLVSIIGDRAVFEWNDEIHQLGVGEDVYLGQVVLVDPNQGLVKVRLNLGGIIDELDFTLDTGDRFRQAQGPVQLAPLNDQ